MNTNQNNSSALSNSMGAIHTIISTAKSRYGNKIDSSAFSLKRGPFDAIILRTTMSVETRKEVYRVCRISHGMYSFVPLLEIINVNGENNNSVVEKHVTQTEIVKEAPQETQREYNVTQTHTTVDQVSSEIDFNINPDDFIPKSCPDYVSYGFHSSLKTILKSQKFFPVYVTGVSGIGKNMTIEQVCAELKRPVLTFPVTELTTEEELFGSWTLVNGNTVFLPGPVLIAAKYGMVLVLDELDLASPKIMCLQGLLNGDNIFIRYLNRHLNPKKGFTVIATGNTKGYGESSIYVGTQSQNEALLERFRITFGHDFPNQKNYYSICEKKMKNVGLNLSDEKIKGFADVLSTFTFHISGAFNSGSIEQYISNRRLSYIIEIYQLFNMNKVKALSMAFNRFPEEVAKSFMSTYTKLDANIDTPIEDILASMRSSSIYDDPENLDDDPAF